MNRRQFIGKSAAGTLAGVATLSGVRAQEATPEVHRRTMGATGIEVGDIAIGTHICSDKAVVRYALDLGLNYLDTAREYQKGNSERMIAEAIAEVPRDQFVIADKVPWYATAPEDMFAEADTALELLGLDYVDFMLYHKMDTPEMVTQEWVDVAEELKKQGKARHWGISTHIRQVDVARRAMELGAEQILFGFGVAGAAEYEALDEVITEAGERGVAVVAMKTASAQDQATVKAFEEEGLSFYVACLKWALQNPAVSTVLSEMTTMQMVDENITASGGALTEGEQVAVARFAAERGTKSFIHWDHPDRGCRNGVAIAEILRHRAYYIDYGQFDMAQKLYQSLPHSRRPGACSGCPACDAVRSELKEAERYLA